MVRFLTICCFLLPAGLRAQPGDPYNLLERAKTEMKAPSAEGQPDYVFAGKLLETVVKVLPEDAEAWYYYGCAIDRYNHQDGESIISSNLALTENASLAFEHCLRLCNNKYTGDILVLDPHTKILAAWGAQALYYLYNNKRDSAEWCMGQAQQRGGINKTVVTYFKRLADECSNGSYLFTVGDMYTYYLLYMQVLGHYRQDITFIDLNLLGTKWYPKWLAQKGMAYSYSLADLDKLKADRWATKEVSIPNKNESWPTTGLAWQLKATQGNQLTRPSQLLLDILQQNAFIKPLYFAGDVPSTTRLYLDDYLQPEGLTNRLLPVKTPLNEAALAEKLKSLPVLPPDGGYLNSRDNIQILNNYRFAYTTVAIAVLQNGHNEEARALIETAERKYPETMLPFFADATKQWFEQLKKKAESDR